jgi:hypothetical protein
MPAHHKYAPKRDVSAEAQKKLTANEAAFATAFLRSIHANYQNLYLVLAVVAWMRESGQTANGSYKFNNPFGDTHNGGQLVHYSSMGAAAKALASKFLHSTDPNIAQALVRIRQMLGNGQGLSKSAAADLSKANAAQAEDLLTKLAESNWAVLHYDSPDGDPSTNQLMTTWYKLTQTGYSVKTKVTKPAQGRKAPPQQPRSQYEHFPIDGYIQPYAEYTFYTERHGEDDNILPGIVG